MTIYEQIKEMMMNKDNQIISPAEVKSQLKRQYGTNSESVILSDYCYNRYNKGITFNKHLFLYVTKSNYKYIGENFAYTGLIFHKPQGQTGEFVVGEWRNGVKELYNEPISVSDAMEMISTEQIIKLYEDYNQILQYEMNLLGCKPTELRHLIGRIGEFLCAIVTKGSLSRQTNQHGFDVVSNGKKISVKTTAQTDGFITLNQNTFDAFDEVFVVQYVNDDFKVIYFGPKEQVKTIARQYDNKFEVDINRLKKIYAAD
ncbi:DUF6998 domain-containing protein [Lysinibacillus sp. NPDC097287]|uniref:DUF7225 domain-containing protein n=1 Tax=Lysinibacillus sp. NPDC097287 TaxID=3364144 RepID=UPI003809A2FB